MKQATFTYKGNPTGRKEETIYDCTVTLKNDNKVSISIKGYDKFHHTYAAKFAAQKLAKEIAAADFNHPAVNTLKADDNTLVEILKEKTEELHIAYIEHVTKWAHRTFQHIVAELAKPMTEWWDRYGVKWDMSVSKYAVDQTPRANPLNYNRAYYKCKSAYENAFATVKGGEANFVAQEVKEAELHYADSISKLAYRLQQKGVTVPNMKIVTARVGINLEITITCNGVVTRAWTIVAEGPIQRAHYRYLVK